MQDAIQVVPPFNEGPPEDDLNFLNVKPKLIEVALAKAAFICALLSILITVGFLYILFSQSALIFSNPDFSLREFLTGTVWQPSSGQFGILPLLSATMVTSVIAMAISFPIGVASAIYISEIAPKRLRLTIKTLLELLTIIPSIVYGFFALLVVSPLIRGIFGPELVQHQNMLSAGIAIGFMIYANVTTLSEDAIHAVPDPIREKSRGVGATRFRTAIKAVLPAASPGIASAFILGFSRAFGETMIVSLVSGSKPNMTLNPFMSGETITGHIIRISGGELSYGSIEYRTIYLLGLALFVVHLTLMIFSKYLIVKYQRRFE